ncbi:MAG: M18 family aminopeptidase [Candidatus Lernaella stagnicola]|nr:M18 family aminopeptidase [Candidatus Lernaella stagnicola]
MKLFPDDLLHFLENSPTAVHTAAEAAHRLEGAGFRELHEKDAWELKPGDAFFVRRGGGSLAAGIVGQKAPAEVGLRLVGAHTDVPALRVKPRGVYSKEGYRMLGVEVYGEPILATWFDRDLTLAGVLVASKNFGPLQYIPVSLKRPVARIANCAIHLNRKVNEEYKVNKQKHLPAIYALDRKQEMDDQSLRCLLAEAAGINEAAVQDYMVDLVDTQPPTLGGLEDDFLFARGIDNLVSCHAAIWALIETKDDETPTTRIAVLFDNEEVGSNTFRGAGSTLMDAVIERLCLGYDGGREGMLRTVARSVLVSVDGAHAVHPNYAGQHDANFKPQLGGGPTIKVNANERYATTAATRTYLTMVAEGADIPLQQYVHRSDLPCGSTIGPISATRLGVATVDVGVPMLSMHSIRETTTVADCQYLAEMLGAHFTAGIDPVF